MSLTPVTSGYTDGSDTASGTIVKADLNTIITEVNAHEAASPIDHPAGSVTATALGALAVETAKINTDAVTSAKIADQQVLREHLVVGRAYSHTGGGTEATQGGDSGVYTVTTAATNADGSVIKDSNNLTAADNTYKDMVMVVLTCADDATIIGNRYIIASSDQSDTSITLQTAANGGGNLGVSSPLLDVGDTFKIVKSPVCAVHIGDNEIRTEHILDGEVTVDKLDSGALGPRSQTLLNIPGRAVLKNKPVSETTYYDYTWPWGTSGSDNFLSYDIGTPGDEDVIAGVDILVPVGCTTVRVHARMKAQTADLATLGMRFEVGTNTASQASITASQAWYTIDIDVTGDGGTVQEFKVAAVNTGGAKKLLYLYSLIVTAYA